MEIKEGYTRVSEILSPWSDFSHIDPVVLANKCRIGTNVHERISCDEGGIFVELQEDERPYYDSWIAWRKENPVEILHSERRMYSDTFKLTGCIDAIVESGSKKILLDFKTSASANKKMWALQGALYHWLCIENGDMISDEFWFLQLVKNGKGAKLHKFFITSELTLSAISAVNIYRYFNCGLNV